MTRPWVSVRLNDELRSFLSGNDPHAVALRCNWPYRWEQALATGVLIECEVLRMVDPYEKYPDGGVEIASLHGSFVLHPDICEIGTVQ